MNFQHGIVKDASTKEFLIGANILVNELKMSVHQLMNLESLNCQFSWELLNKSKFNWIQNYCKN
ncbi:MAG: hypothetical protein H6610_08105 [Ignavibacteriales bacterium]|nr:hypothetical protein [Ignavibacteriales bacterium]